MMNSSALAGRSYYMYDTQTRRTRRPHSAAEPTRRLRAG